MACLLATNLGLILCTITPCSQASAQQSAEKVVFSDSDQSANLALTKILELETLTKEYRLQASLPSFNRARRTWLWDIGNALPTEAGLISATALFSGYAHDRTVLGRKIANHLPADKIVATIIPQIAGQAIGGCGSAFEVIHSVHQGFRLRRLQLNRAAVIKRALVLRGESNSLIAEYERTLVERNLSPTLEAAILRKISNHAVGQLELALAANNKQRVSNNIEDSVSLTRNTVGGIGNAINVAGVENNNKRQNGNGAILNLTAASLITIRPFLSNGGLALAKYLNKKHDEKVFGDFNILTKTAVGLPKPPGARTQMMSDIDEGRVAIYRAQEQLFMREESFEEKQKQQTKQIMLRRFRESLYGPTKIAQSTCGIVVGFRSQNNSTKDYQVESGANITYMTGQAFNIFELARERIVDERRHAAAKASQQLPEDKLNEEMRDISEQRLRLPAL